MKSKNAKRFAALVSLGFAYGIIYLMPYMKSVFYDSMLSATGFTNAQLGQMMTVYALGCTISYLPGGWIADKIRPRVLLTVCMLIQGLLGVVFMFIHTNFFVAMVLWIASALCGGFAFWPSMLKAIRMLGSKDEQGRLYGIFEAINGAASMISSWIMVAAATWLGNYLGGFTGAVLVMALLCFVGAAGVWFLYDENGLVTNDALDPEDIIKIKDFGKVIVMPRVWIAALLLFVGINMYDGLGYIGAYSTEVVGIAVATAGILNSVREYGCRVGGIFGGFMADKVFHSSAKWQIIAQCLTAGIAFTFLVIPSSSAGLFICVMMLMALAVYANRVTVYSLLSEMQVETKVAGTALALVTLIGYVPDMYVHTMFGTWLDKMGSNAYSHIFTYLGCIGCAGIVIAIIAFVVVKKITKASKDEQVA
jgi:Sugar phosphate permease